MQHVVHVLGQIDHRNEVAEIAEATGRYQRDDRHTRQDRIPRCRGTACLAFGTANFFLQIISFRFGDKRMGAGIISAEQCV